MAAGIYFSYLILNGPWFALMLIPIIVLLFIRQSPKLLISVFLLGSILFLLKNYDFAVNRSDYEKLEGREITVAGSIYNVQEYSINTSVTIQADTIYINGKAFASDIKISTYLPVKDLEKGDDVCIKGKFQSFIEPVNLYEKDMRKYAFVNNISGEVINPKVIKLKRNNNFWRKMASSQDYIIEIYDRRLSFSAGNFLTAIVIGKRDKLESSVTKDFADSGTIHLLSVSGLHVAFVVLILSLMNSLFNLKGLPYIFINSAALVGYAVFTGLSSPVIRAVLMAIIFMLSFPLKRKLKFLDVIGTAGIISLLYDPNQIFGAGFILTFAAVASIAVIYEPVSVKFNDKFKFENYFLRKFFDGVILSATVTVGMLPFVLYMFGRYNFLSILSNVFVIPLTGAAFLSGFVLILVDKIDILAQFVSDIINLTVWLISEIVAITADLEIFTLQHKFDIVLTAVLLGSVIIVFYLKDYLSKIVLALILICVMIFEIIHSGSEQGFYIFKTKAGNTVLVESCGQNILIAGKLSRTEINRILNPYLLERNITSIDYFITFEEWFETEKALKELKVSVRDLVSDKDYYFLEEKFSFIDLDNINRIIKFKNGLIYFNKNRDYKIYFGKSIFDSKEKRDFSGGVRAIFNREKLHYKAEY